MTNTRAQKAALCQPRQEQLIPDVLRRLDALKSNQIALRDKPKSSNLLR